MDIYTLSLVQIVHEKVYDEMLERLLKAYKQVKVGNAVEENTLCGPLHSKFSVTGFEQGIKKITAQASLQIVLCL